MSQAAPPPDGLHRGRADESLFLALVALLPIVMPFAFAIGGLVSYAADLVFLATLFAWFVSLLRKRATIRWSWFYLPLGLYLAALAASTVGSEDLRRSALKFLGEGYLIALAVLTFNLVRSMSFLRRVCFAWMVGTAVSVGAGLLGVVLFYAGWSGAGNWTISSHGSLPAGDFPRISGLHFAPNMFCDYLNVSLMIAYAMRRLGWLRSGPFFLLLAGIWIAAAFTWSPGLGGMLLAAGLWAGLEWREQGRKQLARWAWAGGALAALGFFLAASLTLFSYNPTGAEFPMLRGTLLPSQRAGCWVSSLQTFARHPLLGVGVGLEVASVDYRNPSGILEHLTDAHNMWLSVAAQEGAVGLLAFTSVLAFALRGLRLSLAGGTQVAVTSLAIAFLTAMLYHGLTGSFEDARHLWVLLGLLVAARSGLGQGEEPLKPG